MSENEFKTQPQEMLMEYLYLAVPVAILFLVFSVAASWWAARKGRIPELGSAVRHSIRKDFLPKEQGS